jgi:CubicO group peptidase (beta-lactamase class C family)
VQSVLACGGEVRGVRLLSRAGCERALEVQADDVDLVCGYPLKWGLGYGLENPFISAQYRNRPAGRKIAFWGGSGGSIVVNDFEARMTIAFVMNLHMEHGGIDQRGIDIVCAAYDSLAAAR